MAVRKGGKAGLGSAMNLYVSVMNECLSSPAQADTPLSRRVSRTYFHERTTSLTSTTELEAERTQMDMYIQSYGSQTQECVTELKGESPFNETVSKLLLKQVLVAFVVYFSQGLASRGKAAAVPQSIYTRKPWKTIDRTGSAVHCRPA